MADESNMSQSDPAPGQPKRGGRAPLTRWRGLFLGLALLVTVGVAITLPSTPVNDRMLLLGVGSVLTGTVLIVYARATGAWWFWGVFGFVPVLGLVMTLLGVAGERLLVKRGLSRPAVRAGLALFLAALLSAWALFFMPH